MKLDARCQQIEMILSDVDGVLTDGGVVFDNNGIETKKFHIRDGMGIKLWMRAGFHRHHHRADIAHCQSQSDRARNRPRAARL